MHEAFREGFAKQALLWSKEKDPQKFLALAKGLVAQRAKNEGVSVVESHSPFGKLTTKAISWAIKQPEAQLQQVSDTLGARSYMGKNTVVVPPKSPLGFRHVGSDRAKESVLPIVTHHELDELDRARHLKMSPAKLKWQQGVMYAKDVLKKGPASAAADRYTHGAPLGYRGFHSHISPEVMLRESNRTFHEAIPEASQTMKGFREATDEAATLKRHGLRYGEEYIPEGGRRWRKLVSKLEGTMAKANKPRGQ